MKEKISSLLKRIPLLLTAITTAVILFTPLEARASGYINSEELSKFLGGGASVDSQHSNTSAGNQTIVNGVSKDRTGYLVYLLDNQGNRASNEVWAFNSPNFTFIDEYQWMVQSRKGNFSIDNFNGGEAPWGVRPWESSGNDVTSNEPTIKAWFKSKENGVDNSLAFVNKYFGTEAAHKFGQEEAHIVVEIIMHLQFSYGGGNGVDKEALEYRLQVLTSRYAALSKVDYTDDMKSYLMANGFERTVQAVEELTKTAQRTVYREILDSLRKSIQTEVLKVRSQLSGAGTDIINGREMVKPALVGTVPNLVKFKSGLSPESTVFDSYLNKAACFASYIHVGDIGEKIGFTAYSDGIRKLSNAEVQSLGVAMMVISCADAGQTTADEPKIGTVHEAPQESSGTYVIVKNYRTKKGETDYNDDGCTIRENVTSSITIENESPGYKVIEWKITNQFNGKIPSHPWNPPGGVQDSGEAPIPVKIKDPYKVLYVLLEKEEEEPPEPEDYNYLITESQITRRIKMSEPDNQLSMPDILNHTFKWVLPAHKTTCSGHTWTKECDSSHTRTVKVSDGCPDNCTKDQLDPTHQHQGAQYDTQNYNCGQNCKTQTAYCSGWQWKNKDLKLSLHNANQQSAPTILAIKTSPKNWFYNPNTNISKLVQGFYRDNNTFDREATSQQIYENKNWDYICVIHRGQDKLNLAEWINNGQGQYDPTEATINLQGVNNEVYQASNQSSGQRKQNGFYTETFQVSIGRQEHGVEQTDNETIYAPTIPSSVPGQSPLGSTICPDDVRWAQLNPLSFNVIVRVEVYQGLETTDKHDGFEDGHTSKPRGDYSIVSGRMIKGSNISFIPYILMKYDTIDEAITDAPAYVMGEHARDMSLLHYGEIAWNKSSNPNLLSYYNYIFIEHCYTERCFFIV